MADISTNGIVMTGGGSLVSGFDKLVGSAVSAGETLCTVESETIRDQIESARLNLQSAQLSASTASGAVDDYNIKSPIAGTVIEKNFKAGDKVDGASSGTLAVIYDLSYLKLEMAVAELDIGKVEVGQRVEITADALEDQVFEGVVDKVSINGNTTNGFTNYPVTIIIEDYGDPLGRKASWEGIVNFMDKEACHRTEVISDNAQWFEDHSPVAPAYRKEKVKGVSAKVITAAVLGGDCYPATPIGINLPNADWIRKEYGSKSVTIDNITYAYDMAAHGNGFNEEFVLRAEDRERMERYGKLADDLHTDLHECLGHGSGQLAPGVKGGELKSYGSTLEETRADLFGLYYLGDPKLVELGLIPSLDVAKAGYAKYILNGMMTQLARIEPGKNVEESHMRNRKLICEWCYERGKADNVIEMIRENGKTYVVVNDYEKLRRLFGDMLREVQRIKSEGDYEAGKALVERYAVQVDPQLHREVRDRYYALGIEPYGGFVNPEFELVEKDGKVVDVKISYPANYVEQMLGYSKDYSFLPNIN